MEYSDLHAKHHSDPAHEKRITNIIIKHWESARGSNLIAAEKDLDPNLLDVVLDNCFLIEAKELIFSGKHRYIYRQKYT